MELGELVGGSHTISVKHMYGSGQSFPVTPKCVSVASLVPHSVEWEHILLAMSYPPTILGPQKEVWPGVSKEVIMLQSRDVGWSEGYCEDGEDGSNVVGVVDSSGSNVLLLEGAKVGGNVSPSQWAGVVPHQPNFEQHLPLAQMPLPRSPPPLPQVPPGLTMISSGVVDVVVVVVVDCA
mgnify:CR=1 FL=1